MTAKNITLKIVDAKSEVSIKKFTTGKIAGEPVHVKALDGVHYVLSQDDTAFSPVNIALERSGENLFISFLDADSPDVVIEGYYLAELGKDNLVIGQHENGQYYSFVPMSGDVGELVHTLTENVLSIQALGGSPVDLLYSGPITSLASTESSLTTNADGWGGWAFLGATIFGVGVASLLAHRSDDNSADEQKDNPPNGDDDKQPQVTAVVDKISPDNGEQNDFITNKANLIFSGKVSHLQPEHKVQISVDKGINWLDASITETINNNEQKWTVDNTANSLADGNQAIRVRVVDAEGKAVFAPEDQDQRLTIDTLAPNIGIIIDPYAEINDKGYEVHGESLWDDKAVKEKITIQFSIDEGKTWYAGYSDEKGTPATVDKASGTWTVLLPQEFAQVEAESHNVQVRAIDEAGNLGGVTDRDVIVKESIGVTVEDTAITLHPYANSILKFKLLDGHENDALAGYKRTEIKGFTIGGDLSDYILLKDILIDATKDKLGEYFKVEATDSKTTISIDRDGSAGMHAMTEFIILDNVNTTFDVLKEQIEFSVY